MKFYSVNQLVQNLLQNKVNISPRNRWDWVRFGGALRVLGYDLSTFAALSDPEAEAEAARVWKNNPNWRMTPDQASAQIVALAKEAGVDLAPFRLTADTPVPPLPRPAKKPEPRPEQPPLPRVHISPDKLIRAAAKVKETNLYLFLCSHFPAEKVEKVLGDYRVGASRQFLAYWPGEYASAFPYINKAGKVVDVHLMAYDKQGHRRRDHGQHWALAAARLNDRRDTWPLFGEHLTAARPTDPIGIVESEKTALIAAVALPRFVWCATASMANLTPSRLQAVKDRELHIFPDLDAVGAWRDAAARLRSEGFNNIFNRADYIISRAEGNKDDLADIIIRNQHEVKTAL